MFTAIVHEWSHNTPLTNEKRLLILHPLIVRPRAQGRIISPSILCYGRVNDVTMNDSGIVLQHIVGSRLEVVNPIGTQLLLRDTRCDTFGTRHSTVYGTSPTFSREIRQGKNVTPATRVQDGKCRYRPESFVMKVQVTLQIFISMIINRTFSQREMFSITSNLAYVQFGLVPVFL